jgi:anthranilate synthase component 1
MFRPDLNEFLRLASSATLVPVSKSVSADLLTPVSAFLAVAEREPHAFLLESVEGGEKVGRYTFLGTRPYMRIVARRDGVWLERGRLRKRVGDDPIAAAREEFRIHRPAQVQGLPPFTGGAVGYFAYDFVRRLEPVPARTSDDLEVPDCLLMFFDRLLAFDHVRHQIHIIAIADVGAEEPRAAYKRAQRDIDTLERKLAAGLKRHSLSPTRRKSVKPLQPRANTSKEKFLEAVEKAKQYIAAGDIFQVVLSQRLEFDTGTDPFVVYRALRTVNPSPYMYFLRMGKLTVLGSSPEMLVRCTAGKLEYRPIAGTLPRGATDEEDAALERRLRNDEKERAEHVMLVDLGRNDVGRVSEYGSVKVKDLMYVERYSHVMHLVSAIEGKLRPDLDALDAFAACFPAGTLTGAPKVRAMQIIEELEATRRGVYGGSVLYADFAGNLDSCIAIRSMLVKDGRAYVQAGAGIVADSQPEREYEECMNKARAVVRAAEIARGE